jgi:hypothetical protein
MAAKKRILVSPPPWTSLLPSLTLSTLRTTPLASGSLVSYPVTSSPFSSSPVFSFTQTASSPLPDLFDTFEYTKDMDDDLRRIDLAAESEHYPCGRPLYPPNNRLPSDSPPLTPPQDEKTWVVFRGKIPGIYDNWCVPPPVLDHSRAYMTILVCQQRCKLRDTATLFREPSLIAIPPALLGSPSSETEPIPTTAGGPGLSSSAGSLAFLPKCECS